MSNNTTQHTHADVRGRIIRASILPFEDEETLIAGLRAGAEAVERGELDVDDFVGVWSQYLRQLLRASAVPAPADVRELAAEIIRSLDLIARNYDSYEYGLPVMTHYDEMVDTVVALLRTPRGEGEAKFDVGDPVALRLAASKLEASGYDVLALRLRKIADQIKCVIAARRRHGASTNHQGGEMSEGTLQALRDRINARLQTSAISRDRASAAGRELVAHCRQSDVETLEWVLSEIDTVIAALRSEAQGDAEALAALIVRIWTRCKNEGPHYRETDEFWADFERAYQLAASHSEAQGEDRWEDLIFGTLIEAYNEAHAARRSEGGGA